MAGRLKALGKTIRKMTYHPVESAKDAAKFYAKKAMGDGKLSAAGAAKKMKTRKQRNREIMESL